MQYLKAYMEAARQLTTLAPGRDVREETGSLLVEQFGADFIAFASVDGGRIEIGGRSSLCPSPFPVSEEEMASAAREVFEKSEPVTLRSPGSTEASVFVVPVDHEFQVFAAMLAGFAGEPRQELQEICSALGKLAGAAWSRAEAERTSLRAREERAYAKKRILRLNRLYAVLGETSHAIVHARNQESLFREVCRIAVEHGGFRLAWIGLSDGIGGRVKGIAYHGDPRYLDDFRISPADEPEGRGPIGIVMREGTFYVSNDFLSDPRTMPWHERAAACGFRSSASLVLQQRNGARGVFTLYADEKDFFSDQIVDLLRRLAADISAALDNLEWELRLRESEEKFRTLFEESKDVIYIMNYEGRLMDVNAAGSELFGYTRDELLALDIDRELYLDPADRQQFLKTLFASGFVRDYDVRMKDRAGNVLYLLKTASVIRNQRGESVGYRGIIHDVSARRRLEQQLLQAQKMESIGLLAGGIAHDFNNLLTVICGYGQLLHESVGTSDATLRPFVEEILGAAGRATDLTKNLLAFSRKQVINLKAVDINSIIVNVSKLLMRIIGEDIEFSTSLLGRELVVMADAGQIDQVLINLATNARDAMPRGGKLQIRTEQVNLDEAGARACDVDSAGSYALVSVSDTGHGIEKDALTRIFEPFYTTKATGKGTGLGLSINYGIIKQHNGTINVMSEPGRGTTFAIFLPITTTSLPAGSEENAADRLEGNETLLLAEDDDVVREFLRKTLEMAGYTVITAVNGEEAVLRFNENRESIALLLCDVVMPKKNGKEVYDEIIGMEPSTRFVFISGYNDEIIHSKGIPLKDIEVINKPVSRQHLLQRLRRILGSPAAGASSRPTAPA